MTPTEQDKELREKINSIFESVFYQGVRAGKDVATDTYEDYDAWRKKDELGKVMQLTAADRKRVALEARIDELNSLMDYTDENEIVCVCEQASVQVCDHNWSLCHTARERIAELKAQQEEV